MDYSSDDFTQSHYQYCLELVSSKWGSITFESALEQKPGCLWRHDIDISPQRALALAKMENLVGVRATYFVMLHSEFYNVFESEIVDILKQIVNLGHEIGLHFDPTFKFTSSYDQVSDLELDEEVKWELGVLERLVGVKINSISFHNPAATGWINYSKDRIAGLVNAYSATIKSNYVYCSDSNGYWRYQRLFNLLDESKEKRLHILTHPVWWTPEPLSPKERIQRAIEGRSVSVLRRYQEFIEKSGGKLL